MRYFTLSIISIILIACSSNPVTPKIEEQLRCQMTKKQLEQDVDSAYKALYKEGFYDYYDHTINGAWGPLVQYANNLGRFSGVDTDSLWDVEYQKTNYCKSLMNNYQTAKSILGSYSSDWMDFFSKDNMDFKPSVSQVLENGMKEDGHPENINDRVLRFIHFNRAPMPKLHLEEELEDNYFKVLDLNSNKEYILNIENDSLCSYTVVN